jgi:hypothetical protein
MTLRGLARAAGLNPAIVFDLEVRSQGRYDRQRRTVTRYAGKLAQALGVKVAEVIAAAGPEQLTLPLGAEPCAQLDLWLAQAAQRPTRLPDWLANHRGFVIPGGAFLLIPEEALTVATST